MFKLDSLRGCLVASVQALETEALHGSFVMAKMAKACVEGGASAIRANSKEDIDAIKQAVNVPVIGIVKRDYPDSDVYITATKKEVEELLSTRCEIIALDATFRPRPNQESLEELLLFIKQNNRYAMADISTIEEALYAKQLGFDLIGTTLAGYTPYSRKIDGPDIRLLKECRKRGIENLVAEGRIHSLEDMKKVQKQQPFMCVVGGAITRPKEITERFVGAMRCKK